MNKCYEVLDGTNTVTFTVTGKRSELEKLDDTDFSAVADMNRLIINDKGIRQVFRSRSVPSGRIHP